MAEAVRCLGAVLAGGASSRMGTDKAFVEIGGVPMVVRAVEALRAAGPAPVLVVGGDRERLHALGLDVLEDRYPGAGPLGGVITALGVLDSHGDALEAVVTMPCDVISPDAAAVRRVLAGLAAAADSAGGSADADLIVPIGAGAPQWAHAAWRRRCLGPLTEAFERGVRALREVARQLQAVEVEVPGEGWFRDADRPEDLPPGRRARP
ncbi:MAG: molybdenum cofactor guanylyltransferase [Acidimicrobiaceae bacterium]|nr:molybdenum cofactor guanylyltransferase [Acidimicrobiaceae bacterium]